MRLYSLTYEQEERIYTQLTQAAGDDPETIAARFGVPISVVQAVCGDHGHEMAEQAVAGKDHAERVCKLCDAPDEEDDEP